MERTDEEARVFCHYFADTFKDLQGLLLGPIVNDVPELFSRTSVHSR